MSKRRKILLGAGVFLLGCCVLSVIASMFTDGEGKAEDVAAESQEIDEPTATATEAPAPTETPEPTATVPPTDTPEPTVVLSPEDELLQSLNEVLGDSNRGFEPKWTFNDEDGSAFVNWAIDDNMTENMIRDGAKLDIYEMLEQFSDTAYPYTDVAFRGTFGLVDQFGNVSEQAVVVVKYQRETVERINFDGFLFDNVYEIADEFWLHNVMQGD